jgi:hypothetical protein
MENTAPYAHFAEGASCLCTLLANHCRVGAAVREFSASANSYIYVGMEVFEDAGVAIFRGKIGRHFGKSFSTGLW